MRPLLVGEQFKTFMSNIYEMSTEEEFFKVYGSYGDDDTIYVIELREGYLPRVCKTYTGSCTMREATIYKCFKHV